MRRITVSVDENTDLIFREFASRKFKFERGWYSKAVVEAMKLWITQVKSENRYLSNIHESWLNQGIKFIPQDLLIQIRDLSCLEFIEAEYSDLSKTHEIYIQTVLNAKKIKGVSPIFHLDYIETFNKILEMGVDVELILTETVLRKTIKYNVKNLEHLRRLISKNQLKIWEIKEDIKIALTVTDKAMTLGLFTMNGRYDIDRLLLGVHDDALQWGDKLFEYYLKRAKEVDLEYFENLPNHIF
jgi:predicted transcriptional regulator